MARKKLPTSIPRNGLIAQYPFDGSGIDVNDGTKTNLTVTNGTYKNGTIGYQKQVCTFGATTTATRASLTGIQTISFRIYPTANTKNVFQYVTSTSLIAIDASNNITQTGLTNSTIYVNNQSSSVVTLNKWNLVQITHDSKDATNFNFGVSSYLGDLGDTYFYNYKLSYNERQNLYQEGLRQLGQGGDNILSSAVAYYDFNGDANDVIGGNNGTSSNISNANDRFGISKHISYNGTTSKIDLPTTTALSTYSFGAWVKTSTTGKTIIVLGNSGNTTVPYMEIKATTGLLTLGTWNGSTSSRVEGTTNVADGNYHFCFVTKNGTTGKVYVDGVLQTTGTCNNINTGTDRWAIGYDRINNVNFHNGAIDNVYIFNKELSSDEVKELYNISKIRYLYPFKKTLPLNLRDGLIFWGSGDGGGIKDASGNIGDGTISGNVSGFRQFQHKGNNYDGSGDYITFPNINSNIAGGNKLTIGAWIYPTSTSYKMITVNRQQSGSYYLDFQLAKDSNGKIEFATYGQNNTGGVAVTGLTTLPQNKWSFIIGTYDGSNLKCYYNSTYETQANQTALFGTTSSANLMIGRNTSILSAQDWAGKIKDLMIWNRVLSQTEIQQLFYSQFIN